MWLLLFALSGANASEPRLFPWQSSVELPAEGVARIHIPVELRSAELHEDGRDFLLVDADGVGVPFAVVTGPADPDRVYGEKDSDLSARSVAWWPDDQENVYQVRVSERPVEGFEIILPDTPAAANVTVEHRDGDGAWEVLTQDKIWRVGEAVNKFLRFAPALGTFRVRVEPLGGELNGELVFNGVIWAEPGVADERITLPVTAWSLTSGGASKYQVQLPQPWPVQEVVIDPNETLFDRRASASKLPAGEEPSDDIDEYWYGDSAIRRLELGGARLDDTTISVSGSAADRLVVYVSADGQPPLTFTEVQVSFPGVDLLVKDAGPGPHVLYAGAAGEPVSSDLMFAVPELAREAKTLVTPGPRQENATYAPPELREGLSAPSSELDRAKYAYSHTITGEGLSRVALTEEVLSRARSDLGDVRVLDEQNRQIPYLLRTRYQQQRWDELKHTRTERGKDSVIEVKLPRSNMQINTVMLHTSSSVFSRRVTLSMPTGGRLKPLRVMEWDGQFRPKVLSIDLDKQVGDSVVVTIHNGDDPPLPIEKIEVTWPSREIVAVLPPGGATLVYGQPRQWAPNYDLVLLKDQILARPVKEATLGPSVDIEAEGPSMLERGVVLVGVGVMVLGLLVLTLLLLLKVPEKDEEVAEAKDEDEKEDGGESDIGASETAKEGDA